MSQPTTVLHDGTVVVQSDKMPTGIPYIIGNELAERFSYYGMKAILIIFMTQYLRTSAGQPDYMHESDAMVWYHNFVSANYFFPLFGALISDIFWGKYKTILNLSLIYCLGHLFLGIYETRFGLGIGLTLIAIGSGGIKPCVSAHVGDQFTALNKHLLTKVFSYFYLAINLGSAVSTLLIPWLLEHYGSHVAFGLPGVLMLIATFIFWLGRNKFIAIQPVGWDYYRDQLLSPEGKKAIKSMAVIYTFIAVFWSLYDQSGSSWVLQAEKMNRHVTIGSFHFELLSSQIQAINPILILTLTPLLALWGYPLISRFYPLNAMRKITIGMVLAAISFIFIAIPEIQIAAGLMPSVLWQAGAYIFLTTAEVMVSVTSLEFAYTQAPNSMKSFIMAFYLLSISLGNQFTAIVNKVIQNPDGSSKITGPDYYWFFVGLMLATAVVFGFFSRYYKEESYVQVRDTVKVEG